MTDDEILLVKSSWKNAVADADAITVTFYNRLFYVHPHLRPLFKENVRSHAKKFMGFMSFLIQHLHEWDSKGEAICEVGVTEIDYDVNYANHSQIAEAWIYSLATNFPQGWNEGIKLAWQKLYLIIAKQMLSRSVHFERHSEKGF